jgi:hypothetical protein
VEDTEGINIEQLANYGLQWQREFVGVPKLQALHIQGMKDVIEVANNQWRDCKVQSRPQMVKHSLECHLLHGTGREMNRGKGEGVPLDELKRIE